MADDSDDVFLGLNKNGVVLFIILIIAFVPLCWLPFVLDNMKATKKTA